MDVRLLQVAIAAETDVVLVRKRTQRLAELIGFDAQDQNRITTAVSEIARNALEYAGGGQVGISADGQAGAASNSSSWSATRDRGLPTWSAVLAGRRKSPTGMGLGLLRRAAADGRIRRWTPDPVSAPRFGLPGCCLRTSGRFRFGGAAHAERLAGRWPRRRDGGNPPAEPADPAADGGAAQRGRRTWSGLNQELQDTNRGVVALYAELDERADHLRRADELKSRFLSHMSHEFRTPLNSILALSRLLLSRSDGELTGEQEHQVQFIRKAAENLTDAGERPAGHREGGSRQNRCDAIGIHRGKPVRRVARHAAAAAGRRRGGAGVRGYRGPAGARHR